MYDLNKVLFYQEAVAKGKVEGRVEGKVEGRVEGRIEGKAEGKMEGRLEGIVEGIESVIIKMLRAGEPLAVIQTYTGISPKKLQEIINKLRN